MLFYFSLSLSLSLSLSHTHTHTRARAHTYTQRACTHICSHLSISFAISIILRTKISLSTLCLLKDEISHLLNPLLKLPNKNELLFFFWSGYLLRCFPRNWLLAWNGWYTMKYQNNQYNLVSATLKNILILNKKYFF